MLNSKLKFLACGLVALPLLALAAAASLASNSAILQRERRESTHT